MGSNNTNRKSLNIRNVDIEVIEAIKNHAKLNGYTMSGALKDLIKGGKK